MNQHTVIYFNQQQQERGKKLKRMPNIVAMRSCTHHTITYRTQFPINQTDRPKKENNKKKNRVTERKNANILFYTLSFHLFLLHQYSSCDLLYGSGAAACIRGVSNQ